MDELMKGYCDKLGLEVIKYDGNRKSMLKDKEGYLYSLDISNLNCITRRNGTPAKFFNKNPYTKENIVNYLKLNDSSITLVTDDFTNIKAIDKVIFKCPIHGDFHTSWNCIKNGQSCPTCGRIKAADKKRHNIEFIREGFSKEGYILIDRNYIDNTVPLKYICEKHREKGVQKMSWADLITGRKCASCYEKRQIIRFKMARRSHEEYSREIENLYGNRFSFVTKYECSTQKVTVQCNICKETFSIKPSHLRDGHVGCRCRPRSNGENLIHDWLKENKLHYEPEYRIKECKDKRALPFDFAIFNDAEKQYLKCLIEFDGIQHFTRQQFTSSADEDELQKRLESLKRRDNIKNQYCRHNNIKLVRIPYWKINDIYSVLKEEVLYG